MEWYRVVCVWCLLYTHRNIDKHITLITLWNSGHSCIISFNLLLQGCTYSVIFNKFFCLRGSTCLIKSWYTVTALVGGMRIDFAKLCTIISTCLMSLLFVVEIFKQYLLDVLFNKKIRKPYAGFSLETVCPPRLLWIVSS